MSIMDIVSTAKGPVAVVAQGASYHDDSELKEACRRLAAPHYSSFESLFERDWTFCCTGYFVGAQGRLTGFMLTAQHSVAGLGRVLFFGLSAGDNAQTGRAQTVKAYALALLDATRADPEIAWVWGTTISPIVYLGAAAYLVDFAPQANTDPTAEQVAACRLIIQDRQSWGWPTPQALDPFVLRGLSPSVRYSVDECRRLESMRSKAPVFEALGLSEPLGDRLLFLGRPPQNRVTELLTLRVLRGTALVRLE